MSNFLSTTVQKNNSNLQNNLEILYINKFLNIKDTEIVVSSFEDGASIIAKLNRNNSTLKEFLIFNEVDIFEIIVDKNNLTRTQYKEKDLTFQEFILINEGKLNKFLRDSKDPETNETIDYEMYESLESIDLQKIRFSIDSNPYWDKKAREKRLEKTPYKTKSL